MAEMKMIPSIDIGLKGIIPVSENQNPAINETGRYICFLPFKNFVIMVIEQVTNSLLNVIKADQLLHAAKSRMPQKIIQ